MCWAQSGGGVRGSIANTKHLGLINAFGVEVFAVVPEQCDRRPQSITFSS
jgi:hypothetical protein